MIIILIEEKIIVMVGGVGCMTVLTLHQLLGAEMEAGRDPHPPRFMLIIERVAVRR